MMIMIFVEEEQEMIQFIAGIFVGTAIGVASMALVMIAGDARREKERKKRNNYGQDNKRNC